MAAVSTKSRRGVIYVLFNQAYPGALKIGRTKQDAVARARELSRATGVPQPFEVLCDVVVSDAVAAEREIHAALSDERVNPRREFFRVKMRDAVRLVLEVAARYPVNPEAESEEIDILPALEGRMRRWLRNDLVGLHFVQYSDLCLLRMTFQPVVDSPDAYEVVFDLRVLGDGDYDTDDCDICGQSYYTDEDPCEHRGLVFDPFRRSIEENADAVVRELDTYSMYMVGIDVLNEEAADYVSREKKNDVPCQSYKVVDTKYDIWGAGPDDPAAIARLSRAATRERRL
ncbi:GIY-YIG nuclease family protein [Amycolatopsis sp. lyj-84]|uniref:GIY-YIG nuclease family protein n=1 Tax=Amycolatopsis sp. lyj-84 TaxID=2789284 RepID=UPI00397D134C